MPEEISTTRSARNRRTIAILTWIAMVILAATLWICRRHGITRNYTSEPIALMLSAYAAFVSVFCWMLFAPGRRALKESPALFLCAAVTLLPPCIIAFHLMPPDSPLRGWLTLGTFMFSAIAVLSPVPDEFFAIPRERHTYLRPISGGIFAGVDYQRDTTDFQALRVQTPAVRKPAPPEHEERVSPRDPWADPFADTGSMRTRPGRSSTESPTSPGNSPDRSANRQGTGPAQNEAPTVPSVPAPQTADQRRAPDPQPAASTEIASSQFDTSSVTVPDSASPARVVALPERKPTADVSQDLSARQTDASPSDLSMDRMKDEFGGEMIEGTVRVRFEPGQKRAHLHIPFDPPLPGVPNVECEAVGEHSLRVKVPVRQTYGIRIEARRSNAADQIETEVGFSAIFTPADRSY